MTNYATIEDYLALPDNLKYEDFENVLDVATFMPLAIYNGKAYTFETMQDIKALGVERFKSFAPIRDKYLKGEITQEQFDDLIKEIK